jgi:hypothetical protein
MAGRFFRALRVPSGGGTTARGRSFYPQDIEQTVEPSQTALQEGACGAFPVSDPAPASLRHHYIAHRAFVRAKVACLRHAQGDDPPQLPTPPATRLSPPGTYVPVR